MIKLFLICGITAGLFTGCISNNKQASRSFKNPDSAVSVQHQDQAGSGSSLSNSSVSLVTSGKDTSKEKSITVEYFLRTLLKSLGYNIEGGLKAYVQKALDLGLIKADELGSLNQYITKAQTARFAIRAIREPNDYTGNYTEYYSKIKDFSSVPDKLKDGVLRACVKGLVYEDKSGKFNPGEKISKAESSKIIDRILYKNLRRAETYAPEAVLINKNFSWQSCDSADDFVPSPIWNAGSPTFSVETKDKKEGAGSLKVSYKADKNAWYCVCISPNISAPLNLYDVDYMELQIYNPYNYERNIQFRFRDSANRDYYCHSNYETAHDFYGTKKMTAGPGWQTVRFYFDHINVDTNTLPADNREMAKDIAQIMLVVIDDDGKGEQLKDGYFLIDDVKFYKYSSRSSAPSKPRLPENFDASDTRYKEYKKLLNKGDSDFSKGNYAGAASEYTQILSLSPNCRTAVEKLTAVYKNNLNNTQRTVLKNQLEDMYFYWITDDFEKAKGIESVHKNLVSLYSKNSPIYSCGASVQTIGPHYNFTSDDKLLETAKIISSDIGADSIKLAIAGDHAKLYGMNPPSDVDSLAKLAAYGSYKKVLDMPFKNYVMWTYAYSQTDWYTKGFCNQTARGNEYREIYDFAKYLLTAYNGTGKNFYLGNWEGDWHLCTFDIVTPSLPEIYAMNEWFSMRQQAIADARRDTPHSNVNVYSYLEVNMVLGKPEVNCAPRLMNTVLPYVHSDYVSYSSYNSTGYWAINAGYMEKYFQNSMNQLAFLAPPADLPGNRVWVGEYGFAANQNGVGPELQNNYMKAVIKRGFQLGVPFMFYWEMYDNEYNETNQTYSGFWLINNNNEKQPSFFTLQSINQKIKKYVADFETKNGRRPTQSEIYANAVNFVG